MNLCTILSLIMSRYVNLSHAKKLPFIELGNSQKIVTQESAMNFYKIASLDFQFIFY